MTLKQKDRRKENAKMKEGINYHPCIKLYKDDKKQIKNIFKRKPAYLSLKEKRKRSKYLHRVIKKIQT